MKITTLIVLGLSMAACVPMQVQLNGETAGAGQSPQSYAARLNQAVQSMDAAYETYRAHPTRENAEAALARSKEMEKVADEHSYMDTKERRRSAAHQDELKKALADIAGASAIEPALHGQATTVTFAGTRTIADLRVGDGVERAGAPASNRKSKGDATSGADSTLGNIVIKTSGLVDVVIDAHRPGDREATYKIVDCGLAKGTVRGIIDCPAVGTDGGRGNIKVTVQGERRLSVVGPSGMIKVVLAPEGDAPSWRSQLFAEPPADAAPSHRNTADYGLEVPLGSPRVGAPQWSQAAALFREVPRTFLMYAKADTPASYQRDAVTLLAGEPVLLVTRYGHLLRANGQVVELALSSERSRFFGDSRTSPHDAYFTTTAPSAVVMPPPVSPSLPSFDSTFTAFIAQPYEQDVNELEGVADRRADGYRKARAPVAACVARVLNEAGSTGGWDVVTRGPDGSIAKKESLTDYVDSRARSRCGVAALERKRENMRKSLRTDALASVAATLRP